MGLLAILIEYVHGRFRLNDKSWPLVTARNAEDSNNAA
jgi:hypothetical protein